jgi:predicted CXXCH cytochrome family protein
MNRAALLGVVAGTVFTVAAFVAGGAPTVSADAGPHVATGSDATPDKCASCHRIHTGQNEYLLKEAGTIEDFCYSCHGNGGPGSDLAVQEGKYYGFGSGPPYGGKVTYGALRGGGFETALINTDDPTPDFIGTLPTGEATQSWHTIDGTTAGTLWGNGALGTPGTGPTYTLDCASCHDPHGNGQFRILRPIPAGSGAAAANVTDQPNPKSYRATNYLSMGADVSLTQISSWCATCHTRYRATTSPPTNSGDAIYTYRHRSDGTSNRACITCHASHGTNALMPGAYSSTVEWPGGGTGTTDNNNSRLLKMNNRGLCIKCHTEY